jgi:predicted GTPase
VGHKLESCTSDVTAVRCIHPKNAHGGRFVLVDTPGFNDTNKPDTEILALIAEWLKTTSVQFVVLAVKTGPEHMISVTTKTFISRESYTYTGFLITEWPGHH